MTHNLDMSLNIAVLMFSAAIGLTGVYQVYKDTGKLELPALYFLIVSCLMVLTGLAMPLLQ